MELEQQIATKSRASFRQVFENKLESLWEMVKFENLYNLPKLKQKVTKNLHRFIQDMRLVH